MKGSLFKQGIVFFSIDFESNGVSPISVGLVAFDHTGKEIGQFGSNIIPKSKGLPDTIQWLKSTTIVRDGKTISIEENCKVDAKPVEEAIRSATQWCMNTIIETGGHTGYLICFPSAFDGHMWTSTCEEFNIHGYHDFMERFPKARKDPDEMNYRDPFGFNHIDGQTFAMGKLGLPARLSLRKLKPMFFTKEELDERHKIQHDAIADARIQGELFFRIAQNKQ